MSLTFFRACLQDWKQDAPYPKSEAVKHVDEVESDPPLDGLWRRDPEKTFATCSSI